MGQGDPGRRHQGGLKRERVARRRHGYGGLSYAPAEAQAKADWGEPSSSGKRPLRAIC